jgi:hypothetical protein
MSYICFKANLYEQAIDRWRALYKFCTYKTSPTQVKFILKKLNLEARNERPLFKFEANRATAKICSIKKKEKEGKRRNKEEKKYEASQSKSNILSF